MLYIHKYILGPLWNFTSHSDAKEHTDLYENSTVTITNI